MTRKQKKREIIAQVCDDIARGKSKAGTHLRAINRRIEKRKGKTR